MKKFLILFLGILFGLGCFAQTYISEYSIPTTLLDSLTVVDSGYVSIQVKNHVDDGWVDYYDANNMRVFVSGTSGDDGFEDDMLAWRYFGIVVDSVLMGASSDSTTTFLPNYRVGEWSINCHWTDLTGSTGYLTVRFYPKPRIR